MQAIAESLKGGGAFSYLMILVGGASVTLCVAGVAVSFSKRAARSSPILSVLAFVCALAIVLLAFLQRTTTLIAIRRSIPAVAIDQKHLLALKGVSEIAPVMAIGLVLLGVPLLFGALLWARGTVAQPESKPSGAGTAVATLGLLGAGAFVYGLGAYADALAVFQTCGPRELALAPGFAHPHQVVTIAEPVLTAIVWVAAAAFAGAALFGAIALRRRANRLTLVSTTLIFVLGVAFALTGRAFAIDFEQEFGRGGGLPMVVVPAGLTLPDSTSAGAPMAVALVAIDPSAIVIDGVTLPPGSPLDAALDRPNLKQLNEHFLPLLADRRVTWSQLKPLIEAAGRSQRHLFQFITQPPPVYRGVMFSDTSRAPKSDPAALVLTLKISTEGFTISGQGGALEPMPLDYAQLHRKMLEIRNAFPDQKAVTLAPSPEITVEQLVKACDAVRLEGGKLLFPDISIGP